MFTRLNTAKKNKETVTELTKKLNLGTENIIARIALCYSISEDKNLDLKDLKDSGGKEYSKNVLFGTYFDYYVALVCQKYKIYKTDPNIVKYLKLHIDDGLELIGDFFQKNKNYPGEDFLFENIAKGLKFLD